eukprot:scaffold77555_cov54-Cyclotella_meneghiniana.AAC.1
MLRKVSHTELDAKVGHTKLDVKVGYTDLDTKATAQEKKLAVLPKEKNNLGSTTTRVCSVCSQNKRTSWEPGNLRESTPSDNSFEPYQNHTISTTYHA